MVGWPFGRRRQRERLSGPAASVPAGTIVYAIGDVHGRLDLLRELEAMIVRHAERNPASRRVIVFVGDYIDRGYESRQVVDHLIAGPPSGFERVCLRGNHEDFLTQFLADGRDAAMWLANGGRETLMSYGVVLSHGGKLDIAELRERLAAAVPPAHRAFLDVLALAHYEGDYMFVHAGIRPGIPLDRQDPHDLLWIRDDFLDAKDDWGRIVVHGHTPTAEPQERANRIGIDTGAYATGRLTCLVLAGSDREFLQT